MRRVPASELERGDWLVCSDQTRVKVAHIVHGAERVSLSVEPQGTHPSTVHRPFSVPARTHFVKED